MPTTADALALDALVSTIKSVRQLKADYSVLLTKLDSRETGSNRGARELFESRNIPIFKQSIRQLSAFKKAALAGVAVCDVADRRAQEAWKEYEQLGKEIQNNA